MMTVAKLIEVLSSLPQEKEVVIATPNARENEYCSIGSVAKGNIENQNTSGDPEYHGNRAVVVIEA